MSRLTNPSITEISADFPGEFPTTDEMNVSSATELTGMMYRPPLDEAEMESYQNLYDIEYNAYDPDAKTTKSR